jgi:hypothetical protein
MFKCQITGKISRPGEKLNRVVVATREKTYYRTYIDEEGNKITEEAARGWEIVKEANASTEGLDLYNKMVEAGTATDFLKQSGLIK